MARRPGTYEYEDEIPCRLCGKAFQAISWRHLRSRHHFTGSSPIEDYKKMFGLSRACSLAMAQKRLRSYIVFLESTGTRWTKERVLDEIRALHAAAKPLNHAAVARTCDSLRTAACKFYGTWDKALAAAGINPWEAAKAHHWTKPLLIREIQAYAAGKSSASSPALRLMAKKLFGSWHAALVAAGITPLRAPRTDWTKAEVRRRIRSRARQGLGLSFHEVTRSEPALAAAARKVMGSPWGLIVQSLGYRGGRTAWTDDALLGEIRHLHRFGRASRPEITRTAIYLAARRRFGSWRKACLKTGVKPAHPEPQRWTKELALRRIRERERRGESLAWREVLKSEKGLYMAASRFFDRPWSQLMRELGHDGGSDRVFWRKEIVVDGIRRLRRHQPLGPGVTVKKLKLAAIHRFGSWEKAKQHTDRTR